MLKLWCAGKLGNCPKDIRRFRFTCLYCRTRRKRYGKWILPPYWIDYTMPHAVLHYALVTSEGKVLAYKTVWETVKVDPRGHFTMLRCAFIICFVKIIARFRKLKKPLQEFCELAANYPTW